MKVVFLEEVEGTARTGDIKTVADGFARNFLLPRKLAAPATQHYITIAEARATKEAKKQDRLDEDARAHLLPKVDGQAYSTEVRVGDQGKLFGSVTARDIAELVQQGTGIEVEHRQIDLKEPIRELGNYDITVKLTRNVLATVSLSVEPIGGVPEVEEGSEEAGEEEAGGEAEATEDVVEAAEGDEVSEPEASAKTEESVEEAEASAEAETSDEPGADETVTESADEEPQEPDEAETTDESETDETVAESADEEPQEPDEEKSETE
ncbi:MAG: 50S ribosomal protein L9 [Chloroflexi bacterium]|nr:50S ribosomal protein L9 [Chloroflexota bacterium]